MIRPNPPRVITVIIAIALCVIGVSGTIYPIAFVNNLFQEYLGATLTSSIAMLCLAVAPFILILGSFFRRI